MDIRALSASIWRSNAGTKRRTVLAITLALLFTAVPAAADDHQLPDKAKTPGKPLLTVPGQKAAACLTQLMGDTVAVGEAISLTMICTPNYSRCIRNVSEDEKKAVYDAYGIPGGEHHGYCDVTQGCVSKRTFGRSRIRACNGTRT